jgi:glc operon protein GlcG
MRNEPTLTDSDAQTAVAAIQNQLRAEGKAAVIAVADAHGELLALLRLDGAPRAPIQIAMNKAFTAARERRPTFEIGRDARHPERGFDIGYYGDSRYVGWGGGVPVVYAGQVIGAVAVSGLHEQEDMRLAALGVTAIYDALSEDTKAAAE